jgi:hypothetical protein
MVKYEFFQQNQCKSALRIEFHHIYQCRDVQIPQLIKNQLIHE